MAKNAVDLIKNGIKNKEAKLQELKDDVEQANKKINQLSIEIRSMKQAVALLTGEKGEESEDIGDLSIVGKIISILKEEGKPMKVKDIAARLESKNLNVKLKSINATLYRKENDKIFKKSGIGTFELK